MPGNDKNSMRGGGKGSSVKFAPLKNQYFLTTIFLVIIGGITTAAYYILKQIFDILTRLFIVYVSMDNNNEAFGWIMRWLALQEQEKKSHLSSNFYSSQRLTLNVKREKEISRWNSDVADEANAELEFLPGPGNHIFKYDGKFIWLSRNQNSKITTVGWDRQPFMYETITLSTYGRDYSIFEKLIKEARELCMKKDHGKTKIYILNEYGSMWTLASSKYPRDFESVILDDNLADRVYDDAKEFIGNSDYYVRMGLPYRRGYLLYGPPGCGKTSFVCAIAARLRLSICVLTLSGDSLDDQQLNLRLHEAPANSIILLEDIDAVFVERVTGADNTSRVTFSGLLNALDGVASQEGRIFFMSTNHIEKLDSALLRPGRCDVKCHFKMASKNQMIRMYKRFYPDYEQMATEFAKTVPEFTISMAAIQEHFMRYQNKPRDAINNYVELLNQDKMFKKNDSLHKIESGDDNDENDHDKVIEEENCNFDEIGGWLLRLGLPEYTQTFYKNNIYTISDLKDIEAHTLSSFGIKKVGDSQRIMGMLGGKKHIVADFEYATPKIIRELILKQFGKQENELADQFLKELGTTKISIHQIKVYLLKNPLRKEFIDHIDHMKNPPTNLSSNKSPEFNPDQFLQSYIEEHPILTVEQSKALLQEDIKTIDDVLELGTEELIKILKIEKQAEKIKLRLAMEKIKKLKKSTKDKDEEDEGGYDI